MASTSRPINRADPLLPASAMKTYGIVQPLATHFREAPCSEVECPGHRNGWVTTINETTEFGQKQAHYIRKLSGRAFREQGAAGGFTEFMFQPGQECFATHQVPLERDPLFIVKGGDWRGDPRQDPVRRHTRAADWVDDFAEHQDKIVRQYG
jgi:hypothetical protein